MISRVSFLTPGSLSLRLVLAMSTTASLLRVGAFRCSSLSTSRLRLTYYHCTCNHSSEGMGDLYRLKWFPRRSRSTALQMASELTKTAISYMRVKELREELASRGLDTDGVRPVLLARLREAAAAERTLKVPSRWRQRRGSIGPMGERSIHSNASALAEAHKLDGTKSATSSVAGTTHSDSRTGTNDTCSTSSHIRSSLHLLQFDGGSRGNPGSGGAGAVLYRLGDNEERLEVWNGVFWLGETTTNNQAEYSGLISGMVAAKRLGIKRLRVEGDSKLVIEQMRGNYRVSSTNMAPLYQRAIMLAKKFEEFNLEHIRREHNGRADTLANMAMDSRWSGSRKGRIVSPGTNLLGAGAGAGAVDA